MILLSETKSTVYQPTVRLFRNPDYYTLQIGNKLISADTVTELLKSLDRETLEVCF